ncbi:adenosylcobinamide-phosphate synthase CbiB [Vibrio rhodolitus]|uniref:adenosylcobinamide-phosphate synthase CbiB n=1 Tax=Vibrio rhodolitus TaxID=2231649 RepID=UPI000E0C77E0|nr:adenosylcobinamide-phosphate synthase CbiB [Vibrio rhodolitus]
MLFSAALVLDKVLGEPRVFHPLVGFGRLAKYLENVYREKCRSSTKMKGFFTWCCAVLPLVFGYWLISISISFSPLKWAADVLLVYLCLGGKSLVQHAMAIYYPLHQGDLAGARNAVQMIVSRDASEMDQEQISIAAVESVLENGNDAVIGVLFWTLLFGAPGALLFRLVNTLDAMWGYKNEKYLEFGFFAAKADDLLGYLPARMTAFGYAMLGNAHLAIQCISRQAKLCSSPNGGVVMCSGAGALEIQLGGRVCYHGVWQQKPPMGVGCFATSKDIAKACSLLNKTTLLWVVVMWLVIVWLLVGVGY